MDNDYLVAVVDPWRIDPFPEGKNENYASPSLSNNNDNQFLVFIKLSH